MIAFYLTFKITKVMKKEVKFLTENSQDHEKTLSFKEKILNELAANNLLKSLSSGRSAAF